MKNHTIKQLTFNTVSGWCAIFVRGIIALLMVPVLLKTMGKDCFGLIGLLSVFVSFSNLADLGLRQALGRELSEQVAKKNNEAFIRLSSTALVLYIVLGSLLSFIGFLISPWFVDVMNVPEFLIDDAVYLIRVYGCFSIIISFIIPVFSSGLTAHLRFDLVNNIQTLTSIVGNLFLLFLIYLIPQKALFLWVGIMLTVSIFNLLLILYFYNKLCIQNNRLSVLFDYSSLKSLFSLGSYMYLLQVTFAISNQSAPIVISSFFGTGGVAVYHPAGRISDLLRPVVLTLTNQLYPLTTNHYSNNDQKKLGSVLIWGTKYTLMLGVLVSSSLYVLAEPFCRLWLSGALDDYMITAKIMKSWAIIDLLTYLTGSQMSILLGMKKMKFLVYSQIPAALATILISIYIVGYTNIGIEGVLYGAILLNLIRRPILACYVAKKCKIKISYYFKKSYAGSIIICFLLILLGIIYQYYFEIDKIYHLLIYVLGNVIIWLISVYFIVLTNSEKEQLHKLLNKIFIKVKGD